MSIETILKAMAPLVMSASSPYVELREQLYSLRCRQRKASSKEMHVFYTRQIHETERKIFDLKEKVGY